MHPHPIPTATLYAAGQPALNGGRTEVAFVLDNVADWQTLANGVREGVEVVVLDSQGDGLAHMAEWLAQKTLGSVDAIHLLGHGRSGAIDLGSITLSSENLNEQANTLAQMGAALTADGDLLLYGCHVAAGAVGVDFVQRLARATGADVAATEDATGASDKGGDWILEFAQGHIESAALDQQAMGGFAGVLAQTTITFSSTPATAWNDGIAEDGDGGSTDIPGKVIQIANYNATSGGSIYSDALIYPSAPPESFSYLTSFVANGGGGVESMSIKSSDGSEF